MKSATGHKFINGYSLSFILHVLLLLLGALYVIKPHLSTRWHQFEWDLNKPSQVTANPGTMSMSEPQSQDNNTPSSADIAASESIPTAGGEAKTPTRIIDVPLEHPSFSGSADQSNTGTNRKLDSKLLQAPSGSLPGGKYGFSSQMESGSGDAYFLQQVKPRITPNQDGEVLMEFRLTAKGTVIMSSLNVITYTSTAYVDAVRKVLPEWKFGFHKAHDPSKMYRIRCRFLTNE